MNLRGGYTNYGQSIGILMLDTIFPRIPGDIGNATTFSFPVKYRVISNVFPDKKLPLDASDVLLHAFINAARELEAEGCKALTTSCGFLAGFQQELANAVNIPIFTSVLSLVPMIHSMTNPNKKIGILTERDDLITESLFLKLGWSSENIPVCISSLDHESPFQQLITYDELEGNYEEIQKSILSMAREHMEKYPDTNAIILECQNFAPFGKMIQKICKVPVFSINQLVEYIASCVDYKQY